MAGCNSWAFVPVASPLGGSRGSFRLCSKRLIRHMRREIGSRVHGVRMCSSSSTTASSSVEAAKKTDEMATRYEPAQVERDLYEWWEESGAFKPTEGAPGTRPFVVMMPPPNVTGGLHMGHAMFSTLEDIMTRFHRMKGVSTVWLPGTDHAGIATQLQVEKELAKEGKTRQEIGRDAFLKRAWGWKHEKGDYIQQQLRRLGSSCDWSRQRFTLDDQLCEAVAEAFCTLHERGLVYRGEYMVNWSPNLQTAVSDLEVEFTEEEGKLYHFRYPVAAAEDLLAEGKDPFLPVATTRPETILGDTAVCVHPDDERYRHLVGRECIVPILGRRIPIIADDYVDMEFGTGALKITPAHDVNDYEIGRRHGLAALNVMNQDASMNAECGRYGGMDRFDCREALWADLVDEDLALEAQRYVNRVPRSQRGGEIVEPRLSKQWFVRTKPLAAPALEAVRSKQVQIIPERFERVYAQWLENIHDWCVSRQLWWGHTIPVWYVVGRDEAEYIVARSEDEAWEEARSRFGPDVQLRREEDVLDTWFSSGLWPFSAFGWPQRDAEDLARFFPNTVLETGYDILFFWVARMMMLSLELTGKAPFETIYLHGLVRDGEGRKMSKSLGNVLDPLELIAQYGTDALRYTLVTGSTPGQDISLSLEKIEKNRNFANKLWNAGRFIVGNLADVTDAERRELQSLFSSSFRDDVSELALPERFIISRLHQLVDTVTQALETFSFGESGRLVHDFLWDEFADWYIETSKTRMVGDDGSAKRDARRTLVYVLDGCLRLLHPFMPFVTEALWQRLPHDASKGETALITAQWPRAGAVDEDAVARFGQLQRLVGMVRNARAEYQVEPQRKISMVVLADSEALAADVRQEMGMLALLAKVDTEQFEVGCRGEREAPSSDAAISLIVSDRLEAFLPMAGLLDYDKEIARLERQVDRAQKDLRGLESRLRSPNFASKAPKQVIAQTQTQAAELQEKVQALRGKIADTERLRRAQ